MRRDLIALITLAFALGFPSPGFPQTRHQHNRNANNEKTLLANTGCSQQCDSEGAFVAAYVVVDVVLTDAMRNSDSSGVDKGGRRSLSVVEAVAVNLASPKKAEAGHKISVLPLLLSGNEVDIGARGNATG